LARCLFAVLSVVLLGLGLPAFLLLAPGNVAGERLTVENGGKDAAFRTDALERLDLGVGPA
jgi:hypothetical protein